MTMQAIQGSSAREERTALETHLFKLGDFGTLALIAGLNPAERCAKIESLTVAACEAEDHRAAMRMFDALVMQVPESVSDETLGYHVLADYALRIAKVVPATSAYSDLRKSLLFALCTAWLRAPWSRDPMRYFAKMRNLDFTPKERLIALKDGVDHTAEPGRILAALQMMAEAPPGPDDTDIRTKLLIGLSLCATEEVANMLLAARGLLHDTLGFGPLVSAYIGELRRTYDRARSIIVSYLSVQHLYVTALPEDVVIEVLKVGTVAIRVTPKEMQKAAIDRVRGLAQKEDIQILHYLRTVVKGDPDISEIAYTYLVPRIGGGEPLYKTVADVTSA